MEKLNKKSKAQNGITLIALVITIIVLLILAGVAINMAIDSDGLFGKANEAAHKWNTSVGEEESTINDLLGKLDEMVPSPMITKWNIASGDEVKIYLYRPNYYIYDEEGNRVKIELPNNTNVTINWGDGIIETVTSDDLQYEIDSDSYAYGGYYITHTYSVTDEETKITITGKCNTITMCDNEQLTSIEQWGNTESIYYGFQDCINLETIASPEKNTFNNVIGFDEWIWRGSGAFSGCSSLTEIPEDLFANCVHVKDFDSAFSDCSSLESIPEKLFENCTSATNFRSTFRDCTSLKSIPQNLFNNCTNVESFWQTFYNCTSLTGNVIPLWERVTDNTTTYEGIPDGMCCYYNCTGLTGYDSIPEYWKAQEQIPS